MGLSRGVLHRGIVKVEPWLLSFNVGELITLGHARKALATRFDADVLSVADTFAFQK
jgi:hypothetical protein